MTDDERQIRIISDYVSEYLPEPQSTWPKLEFERVSYSRWAAGRILKSLYDNPSWTPLHVIEDFKTTMGEGMQKPTNRPEKYIHCKYAYEVACDLEEILMAMMPYC